MNVMSLRFKLNLFSSAVLALSLAAVIALALHKLHGLMTSTMDATRSAEEVSARQDLLLSGEKVAQQIDGMLRSAYLTPRFLATVFSETAQSARVLSREQAREMVRSALAADPLVSSAYTQFEPDAYDGLDAENRGNLRHSSNSGTLEVYWVREDKGLTYYPFEDPNAKYDATPNDFGMRTSEWYLCGMDNKRPCVIEPYLYEISSGNEIMMTSLTVPVMRDGKFIGISGVDINLPVLQQKIVELADSLYGGQANVALVSGLNRLIAANRYAAELGKKLDTVAPELARASADNELMQVSIPVSVEDARWTLLIAVPRSVVFAELDKLMAQVDEGRQSTLYQLIGLSLGILAVVLLVLQLMVHGITQPLRQLGQRMKALAGAEGDLTHQLEQTSHAELNDVVDGFNGFTTKMRALIVQLVQQSQRLRSSAEVLNSTALHADESTDNQRRELESVATAANEMAATATDVAHLSGRTAEESGAASSEVVDARNTLQQTVAEIGSVAEALQQASGSVAQVAECSNHIFNIVETIRGIAEQTNLLALNAAIEAARAGEQGRGFAVVADEVRNLAARTQQATGEIDTLIGTLRQDVDNSVQQMDECLKRVSLTVEESHVSYERLQSASSRIQSISDNTTQVATAAEEQSMVNEEINKTITLIGDAAVDLSKTADQVRTLGTDLSACAAEIEQQLGRFKV